MKRLLLALGIVVLSVVGVPGSSASSVPVATPVNLQVTDVTQSSISVAWGPSQPGPFSATGTKTQATVSWGASTDSRGSVLYRVQFNGTTVATGVADTSFGFGVGAKTKSFRVCVQSYVGSLNSTWVCGTISRGG